MSNLKSRIGRYVQHWLSTPSAPPSIRWLEATTRKLNKHLWRPREGTAFCVDHRLVSHSRNNYEELIPDYDQFGSNGVPHSEVEKAQVAEIQNRVYKSIYWGNLFDHIFPIETRHYELSTDRQPKILVIILLAVTFWMIVTTIPAVMSQTATVDEAILHASNNPHVSNPELDEIVDRFLEAESIEPKSNSKLVVAGQSDLESILSIRQDTDQIIHAPKISTKDWSTDVFWQAATEDERRDAISEYLFLSRITASEEPFDSFNAEARFVVSPNNNRAEILTQITILVALILMINWFVSKKSHFIDVVSSLPFEKRIAAVQLLEETILSHFFLRKKYHYLVAFSAAAVAIFLHYYFMSTLNEVRTFDAEGLLGLSSVDYRLRSSDQPVLAVYWAAQFFIVYMFSLLAWELGALNACMRRWQGLLLKSNILDADEFKKVFRPISSTQRGLQSAGIFFALFALGAASVQKYLVIQPNPSIATDLSWAALCSVVCSWENWLVIYIFSPSILVTLLLAYAIFPSYQDPERAIQYCEQALPDIDNFVASFQRAWGQMVTTKTWIEGNLAADDGATDGDEGRTDASSV